MFGGKGEGSTNDGTLWMNCFLSSCLLFLPPTLLYEIGLRCLSGVCCRLGQSVRSVCYSARARSLGYFRVLIFLLGL